MTSSANLLFFAFMCCTLSSGLAFYSPNLNGKMKSTFMRLGDKKWWEWWEGGWWAKSQPVDETNINKVFTVLEIMQSNFKIINDVQSEIKADINNVRSEIKAEAERTNMKLETMSNSLSKLSSEGGRIFELSLRNSLTQRYGTRFANSIQLESLQDIVQFVQPNAEDVSSSQVVAVAKHLMDKFDLHTHFIRRATLDYIAIKSPDEDHHLKQLAPLTVDEKDYLKKLVGKRRNKTDGYIKSVNEAYTFAGKLRELFNKSADLAYTEVATSDALPILMLTSYLIGLGNRLPYWPTYLDIDIRGEIEVKTSKLLSARRVDYSLTLGEAKKRLDVAAAKKARQQLLLRLLVSAMVINALLETSSSTTAAAAATAATTANVEVAHDVINLEGVLYTNVIEEKRDALKALQETLDTDAPDFPWSVNAQRVMNMYSVKLRAEEVE